jgi:hypothetical protein
MMNLLYLVVLLNAGSAGVPGFSPGERCGNARRNAVNVRRSKNSETESGLTTEIG